MVFEEKYHLKIIYLRKISSQNYLFKKNIILKLYILGKYHLKIVYLGLLILNFIKIYSEKNIYNTL